jgi:OFA family oxalate/formate antiporter-like MFS transporter
MWSAFNGYVATEIFNGDSGASKLTASFMLVAFVAGILIGGRLMDKIGPKIMCIAGSLMMSVGILSSAFITSDYPFLIYLTYGIIGGFGVGTVYTCTVSPIQKWYFDKRGFATGLMVGAFGFSLVLFAQVAKYLLPTVGPSSTFMIFGAAFLIVCVPISTLIRNPPEGYVIPKAPSVEILKHYTPKEMLRTKAFYLIALSLFFILPAYFIINPILTELEVDRGITGALANSSLMVAGIFSAFGRLAVTWVSDRIGRMAALFMIIGLTLIGVIAMIFAEGFLFLTCVALIAFGFGGAAGIYATVTSDNFGTKNMGSNYGYVMLGFGASALIFQTLSTVIDLETSFIISAATCVVSLICILLLKKYSDSVNVTKKNVQS